MKLTKTIALDAKQQKVVATKARLLRKKVGSVPITSVKKRDKKPSPKRKHRGLIYIGHLPHGFYEKEIKQYFRQFGEVTNVKVCRSRNTGNSKGFGYVEFAHSDVAKIAADTMNNYLMFRKRLTVEFIPFEKRPKKIFFGKQSMPYSYTKQKRRIKNCLSKNKDQDGRMHRKKADVMLTRLQKRLSKINKFGINYDLKPFDVPKKIN